MTAANSPAVRRRGLEQWAGLGGVAYVVLFVVGILVAEAGTPNSGSAPAKIERYYSDSGHRDRIFVGWILVVLGLFFLLWFLASLRQTLRRLDGGGLLTAVSLVGGVVYAALALAAIAVSTALKTMSDDTYRHTVYPGLIHAAEDTAYVLHSTAGIGAGAMMIAASGVALRARVLPAWLAWAGVVAGILALASILFFPQILIALWLIVAGVLLFLAGPSPTREAERAAL